jgi:hypothetical protein
MVFISCNLDMECWLITKIQPDFSAHGGAMPGINDIHRRDLIFCFLAILT